MFVRSKKKYIDRVLYTLVKNKNGFVNTSLPCSTIFIYELKRYKNVISIFHYNEVTAQNNVF